MSIFKYVRLMSTEYGVGRGDIVDGLRSEDYEIMSEDAATERAADYIKDSLWAFNPSFLYRFVPEGVDTDMISMLQEKCEGCNDQITALVGDNLEELIEDAIASDGLGHFLSSYDGNCLQLDGDNVAIRNN